MYQGAILRLFGGCTSLDDGRRLTNAVPAGAHARICREGGKHNRLSRTQDSRSRMRTLGKVGVHLHGPAIGVSSVCSRGEAVMMRTIYLFITLDGQSDG